MARDIIFSDDMGMKKYLIHHEVSLPSKSSDYDYDINDPNRRFPITFFHKLIFMDPIINVEIAKMFFSSENAVPLIESILNMIYLSEGNRPLINTIKGIYCQDDTYPSMLSIMRQNNTIIITMVSHDIKISLDFSEAEILFESIENTDSNLQQYISFSEG